MDLMKNKLFFNVLRNRIQEIIENRECNIYLLSDAKKNIDLMNAFYKSGIRERYDVLRPRGRWRKTSAPMRSRMIIKEIHLRLLSGDPYRLSQYSENLILPMMNSWPQKTMNTKTESI
ncbi:hypothetical protein [Mesotoga sp. BH458_6_3_2_1]|uniref:hypothetical protein n=1 Tax=Mesotoga sp. BH458_6_3_2_1 TaxID=1437446 RepID=UPI000EF19150|nr:hypothetical protein [Mesotoga sp. BH458_6_3_2_1]RLL86684.1 hypothetical protein Y697_08110 [Mesotoga sp. BH458_6_3_2_1]